MPGNAKYHSLVLQLQSTGPFLNEKAPVSNIACTGQPVVPNPDVQDVAYWPSNRHTELVCLVWVNEGQNTRVRYEMWGPMPKGELNIFTIIREETLQQGSSENRG